METKTSWKSIIWKGGSGVLGFCCSMLCVMGYYPLVPAFFSAAMIEQRKNILLYIGMFLGMARFMSLNNVIKYAFILITCAVGIRFYSWANRTCGGWAAAMITGMVTLVMNWSGSMLALPDKNELILMCCEGLVVTALTVGIHYVIQIGAGLLEPVFQPGVSYSKPQNERVESNLRLEAFANAFDGLATTFSTMCQPKQKDMMEEIGILQKEITGKLCTDCAGCAICWNESNPSPALNIHQMMKEVVAHKPKEEIERMAYVENCPNYSGMVEEAVQAFARMELNQAWYERLLENRMMIAQQLDAMAGMMEDWSKGMKCLDKKSRVLIAKLAFEAKEKGLLAQDIHIFEDADGHKIIQAQVCSKWGGAIPVKNFILAAERAAGQPLRIGEGKRGVISKDLVEITLYQDTSYYTLPGVAVKKKDGSIASGDNFSNLLMDNGHYVLSLSDGMGSGAEAGRESEMVIDLLEKFLEAGFRKEAAIKMMNSAMVLQGEHSAYSTLDLADLDLYTGNLEMTKIGAAASYIKRRDKTECICAGSLPAGAECQLEPLCSKNQLENGDFLVMVTDGVIEYLHVKNPETKLLEIISDIKTGNAGVLAKTILERVLLFTGGYALDDMTVLVTGFWEK